MLEQPMSETKRATRCVQHLCEEIAYLAAGYGIINDAKSLGQMREQYVELGKRIDKLQAVKEKEDAEGKKNEE